MTSTGPLRVPPPEDSSPSSQSLTVIGDVRIELRASLPDRRFTDLRADHFGYAPMKALVSGTAVNLARHAVGAFRRVDVVAKIGDDPFTPVIHAALRDIGAGDHLAVRDGMPNGLTVMLHDQATAGQDPGVRLLLASRAAPSLELTPDDVRTRASLIADADVVFMDGYSLLSATSREAVIEAFRTADAAGALTAFDLVPHDIDRRLALADLLPVLSMPDLIISGGSTLRRLIPVRHRPRPGEAAALPDLLDRIFPGRPLWLIRHGTDDMDEVLAYRRDDVRLSYHTGYSSASEKTGFGDRLAVSEIRRWLPGRPPDAERRRLPGSAARA